MVLWYALSHDVDTRTPLVALKRRYLWLSLMSKDALCNLELSKTYHSRPLSHACLAMVVQAERVLALVASWTKTAAATPARAIS